MRRALIGTVLLWSTSCHRAEPSDVGEQSRRFAGADALSAASDRAYRANPTKVAESAKLGFVRFPLGPGPEDAIVCDVVEGLIEGQDASAHVVDIFPFLPM